MPSATASNPKVWDHSKYEAIESISAGCLGPLTLGRLTGVGNASRLVTLREIPNGSESALAKAVDVATSIGHSRLLTTLGFTKLDSTSYLASEYVEGLPLLELTRLFDAAEASLTPDVAVRLMLDSLQIVTGVRKELAREGANASPRCLYPDTVWISAAAELMLAEVPVAGALVRALPSSPARDWAAPEELRDGRSDERSDIFAAGALFYELLCGLAFDSNARSSQGMATIGRGTPVAQPLVDIILRALAEDPAQRFQSAQAMSDALLALPEHWIATSADVRVAVAPLARPNLNLEAALYPLSGEHAIDPWDSPTRSLRQRF